MCGLLMILRQGLWAFKCLRIIYSHNWHNILCLGACIFLNVESKIYLIIVNIQTFFLIVLRSNHKIRGLIDFDVKIKDVLTSTKVG